MAFASDTLLTFIDLYASAAKLNRKNLSLKKQYLAINLRNYTDDVETINSYLAHLDVEVNLSFIQSDYIGQSIEFPVSESVRLVRLAQKINQKANYFEKLSFLHLLIEQFRIGDIASHHYNEALDTVNAVFNLRLNDFQQLKYFSYIDLSARDFDENTVIISSTPLSRQDALLDKKHILVPMMQGYLLFKNIGGLLLFKYYGSQNNYFFNANVIESARAYQLLHLGHLLLENTSIHFETIAEHLFRTYKFEDLKFEPTTKTPFVELNKSNNSLIIKGRMYPENPFAFFDSINAWIDYYLSSNPSTLNVFINISYYNTSSSKLLLGLLKKILSFDSTHFKPSVTWTYDEQDEEMYHTIKNYALILDYPITILAESDEVL